MAIESPFLDIGWIYLSTSNDARRSAISGTTLLGPGGSAQYLAVVQSTVAFYCQLGTSTSAVSGSTLGLPYLGILQNTPGPGQAADVRIIGTSKVVAGLTVTPGQLLSLSSTAAGVVIPFASGAGRAIGIAAEGASTGAVFTAHLSPYANFGGSS